MFILGTLLNTGRSYPPKINYFGIRINIEYHAQSYVVGMNWTQTSLREGEGGVSGGLGPILTTSDRLWYSINILTLKSKKN